jgi:DNA-entry nuclease
MEKQKSLKWTAFLLLVLLAISSLLSPFLSVSASAAVSLPKYNGSAYVQLNGNSPAFTAKEKKNTSAFETYSNLDSLGRCQVAYANICKEIMPTEKRGDISAIHPSGWQSNMGWERCHLIGFQLAGENANEKNLITGTHYFNVTGMLPFENMVADYVKETGNHVLYRVTPYFEGSNLVASGVQMEAWSVEDKGEGICFNVYVFNIQPGSTIDYATGGVKKGNVKAAQYVKDGLYSKSFEASSLRSKAQSFSIGCTAPGKLTYKKVSGSSVLTIKKNGKVMVKKKTPAGIYQAKVKIKAAKTSVYKAKSFVKTITVEVTGLDDFVSPVDSSQFTKYDDKIVSGQELKSSIEDFENEPVAIVVCTLKMADTATNTDGTVTGVALTNSVTNLTPANVVQAQISGASMNNSAGGTIKTPFGINYNALLGTKGNGSNPVALTMSNGTVTFDGDFAQDASGNVAYDLDTTNITKKGAGEYISDSASFNANLIKNSAGEIIGILFMQKKLY